LAVVLTAAYFLLFYSGVQIKNIEILGNQRVASQDIKNIVENSLNSQFSESIFLVDSGKISSQLLDNFPAIESVKVKRKFFQTLQIQASERVEAAVFCESAGSEQCYLLDSRGIIFEILQQVPQNISIVRTLGGGQVSLGKEVVVQDIMSLILAAQGNLKDNFQIGINEVLIKSPVRLEIATSEGWKIYFDTSANFNLQLVKLGLLLDKEISPSQRENLRYINLIPNSKAIICDNPTCGGE